jgi:hypothetical protein
MIQLKLGGAALALETSAVALLFVPGSDLRQLASFAVTHAGASALIAIAATQFLPTRYRRQRLAAALYFFSGCFFVPVLGFLALLLSILVANFLPRLARRLPIIEIPVPVFAAQAGRAPTSLGEGGIRIRLEDEKAGMDTRLRALLAVQALPIRVASPLLRQLLGDAVDDIRLVAYGILDSHEKQLNARIHAEQGRLANGLTGKPLQVALERLAELYWELIYQGLVLGDLADHAATESARYLGEAMALAPDDAGLWALRGKLAQYHKDFAGATAAFARAVTLGLPKSRTLPYLAEIAFLQRDYTAVRSVLGEMRAGQLPAKLAPVVEFWCPR